MYALCVDRVTKRFDSVKAVSELSLKIREGSVFGLLGPNGAGKTTTLRMIMRILVPDEGSVLLFNQPVSDETQDWIGYLPEERGLYPRMQVRQVLVFLAALKRVPEREASRRADDWLERLGLSDWSDKRVMDLSKGMQQKVQLIAAVLHHPRLLILDEPFSALDPVNAVVVKDVMLELRTRGITIILSTHRMDQVEMMCDSICLINQGRDILNGDLAEIKSSYGKNTLRIEYSGNDGFLEQPQLIERINRFGPVVEAKLFPGADPQVILRAAVQRGAIIRRFELIEPPLNDIFIEKVSENRA